MRLRSTDVMAGVSVLAVRSLLARVGGDVLDQATIQGRLELDEDQARAVLAALVAQRLVDPYRFNRRSLYRVSTKGLAFAAATAAAPLKRATADRVFADFMSRLAVVNDETDFVFEVTACVLFGSYLTGTGPVSDIDLAIDLVPRHCEDLTAAMERRRLRYLESGRRFRSSFAEACWPRYEVLHFVRGRSRALAFVDLPMHREFLLRRPHKVLLGAFSHAGSPNARAVAIEGAGP